MEPKRAHAEHVSFVMRLWLERGDSAVPEWRWHILHVQSGQGRAFRSLSDVLDFVEEWAGYPPPAPSIDVLASGGRTDSSAALNDCGP